jgi:hypothetical protein
MIIVGQKTQIIWVEKGRLRVTTHGVMLPEEYRRTADWIIEAQPRFDQAKRFVPQNSD